MSEERLPEVLSSYELSERLRIPAGWIRQQAKAGHIPHLRAGRRMLFNPAAVIAALAQMASEAILTVPNSPPISEKSPLVLFAKLELAVFRGDHAAASQAQKELTRCGFHVKCGTLQNDEVSQ